MTPTTVPETTTTSSTTTTVPETTTTSTTSTTTTTTAATTTTSTTSTTVAPPPTVATDTAWDVLQEQSNLSEFVSALESNDLVDLINGAQPVTVLAIDNDSMPDLVTADELRDQILNESLTLAQLEQRRSVTTASDTTLTVNVDPLRVGDATVDDTTPALEAANGYIILVGGLTVPPS